MNPLWTGGGHVDWQTPWALAALALLPLVWLVTRARPPEPERQTFPPLRLLAGLDTAEDTPKAPPPLLVALRALALALAALGLAGPRWSPPEATLPAGSLLIVVDNGWSAAPDWNTRRDAAVAAARAADGPVRILATADADDGTPAPEALTPEQARRRLAALEPRPWLPDARAAARRAGAVPRGGSVVWLSDGLDRPGQVELAEALARIGPTRLTVQPAIAVAITGSDPAPGGYRVQVRAAPDATDSIRVRARGGDGQVLAEVTAAMPPGGGAGTVTLAVPAALAGKVARIEADGADGGLSAGGVRLIDAFARRPSVGVPEADGTEAPLLADTHYLAQGLAPHADVVRGGLDALARSAPSMIAVPDAGAPEADTLAALTAYVEAGGVLVRFAGPRLLATAASDRLLPAPLRAEPLERAGALAGDRSGAIAPFADDTPFAGLAAPEDTRVRRLAAMAPGVAETCQVWAQLEDGTPWVTARSMGSGLVVLVHTSAGPAWSDLAFKPLPGAMLARLAAAGPNPALPAQVRPPDRPLRPVALIDGFGRSQTPADSATRLAPEAAREALAGGAAGPKQPPGLYEGGGTRLAVHAAGPGVVLARSPDLERGVAGATRVARGPAAPVDMSGVLLLLALALMAADALVSRAPRRRPPGRRAAGATVLTALAAAAILGLVPHGAAAQAAAGDSDPGRLSLAYLANGDARADGQARAGLEALSRALAARTAVETGPVRALNPATDDPARTPVIYWLLPDRPSRLSPEALRRLNAHMRHGGLLVVDTSGQNRTPEAARTLARAALAGLEVPPLELAPEDHVLRRSFYLLNRFDGRASDARVWVESAAAAAAGARDGVSPVVLTDGGLAVAWAGGGAPGAREGALRFGINLVMYALTGQYKADQLHVQALLDRMSGAAAPGPPR